MRRPGSRGDEVLGSDELIRDRYELVELLGRGGQGQVARALDHQHERVVVLKLRAVPDPASRRALLAEAGILLSLRPHENLPMVREDFFWRDRYVLVMDWVDGADLGRVLVDTGAPGLPVSSVLDWLDQAAAALGHLHAQGIVHGDVKPANLVVTREGRLVLVDFGVSRHFHRTPDRSPSVGDVGLGGPGGVSSGTPGYAAPERHDGHLGPAADVYGLAATAVALLTGAPPSVGQPCWDGVPHAEAIERALRGGLAIDPARRPPGGVELVELLRQQVDAPSGAGQHRASSYPATSGPMASGAVPLDPPPERADSAPPPLPRALVATRTHSFVGRAAELETFRGAWREALGGERRLVMLGGEPGIGKTELAIAAAAATRRDGATVFYGRCDEGLQVPYQPFASALAQALDDAAAAGGHPVLGRLAFELVRLAPDLGERVPGIGPPTRGDPGTEQYRLFEAVGAWLQAAAALRPVVLVLDDLHWATRPTLQLLRHITTAPEPTRLMVVATYRDTELDRRGHRRHPLVELLADLRRIGGVRRVGLGGLDRAEVAALLEARAGHALSEPGRDLARTVHTETDGNPFFVRELVRHLIEVGVLATGADGRWVVHLVHTPLAVPDGVREVVARRLARLPEPAQQCLQIAAVAGDDFSLPVVAAAGSFDENVVMAALEQAVDARLVVETGAERFRFAHALVRTSVLSGQILARQSWAHRRVAEAIEAVHAEDLADHLTELARHYAAASSAGDGTKAVDYAHRAGDLAMARLAHDEAAECYSLATDLLTTTADPVDERERCRLLLKRGGAERLVGSPAFRATLLEAAGVARRWRDPELLAQAALANARRPFSVVAEHDPERAAVLTDAIELAREADRGRDSAVRARLMAELAAELGAGDRGRSREALSDEATSMARRLGDPATLAEVLVLRSDVIWHPARLDERLVLAEEQLALAVALGDPALEARAAINGIDVAVQAVELGLADERLAVARRVAAELGQSSLRWQVATIEARRATMLGRFDDADRFIAEALELGLSAGQPEAPVVYTTQLSVLRRLQGRSATMSWTIDAAALQHPDFALFDVMRAFAALDLCRIEEARQLFAPVAAGGFEWLPRDSRLLNATCACAFVAAGVGDTVAAADLYERLVPYRHHLAADRVVSIGSVVHPLGLLAAVLERWDEAEACFTEALDVHQRTGARPALALGQLEFATLLFQRGRPADRLRVRNLLDAARGAAAELGMELVALRVDALTADVMAASAKVDDRARAMSIVVGARDAARRLGIDALADALEARAEELALPPFPAALSGAYTAFVGRGPELARLRRCWHKAQGGARQLVLVTGEAGIGKSRLVAELARLANRDGAVVVSGRCAGATAAELGPFVEAMHALVATGLVDVESLGPDLAGLLPDRWSNQAGTTEPGVGLGRRFEAIGALFDRLSADQPVVVVLDDLHASDQATLQLVRHLIGRSSGPGLLVLGTYRDTDVVRNHPLAHALGEFRRDRAVERLALRGLSTEEVVALVAARTGPSHDDEVERLATGLADSAAGSPFFIEEILRHLTESGALVRADGRWRVEASRLDRAGIPEGVRELIGRRLSRLSPAANHVLAAASVLGREVTFDVVRRMVDMSDEVVMVAVDEAQAGDILVERRTGAGSHLAFSHSLVRETLYRELALPDRQRLHLRAAQALEAANGPAAANQDASVVAAHYRLAGAAAEPSAMVAWSVRAADQAIGVFAFEDAAGALRAAVDALAPDPARDRERAGLLERLGQLQLFFIGARQEDRVERSSEALAIYERLGDKGRAAKVHSQLGAHFGSAATPGDSDLQRARRHLDAAAPVLAGGRDRAAGYFHLSEGTASMHALELEKAAQAASRALAIAEDCGSRALWANAALLRGMGCWERGAVDDGGSWLDRAWQVAEELDQPVLVLLVAWTRGRQLLVLDDPAAALGWFERELGGLRFRQAPLAASLLERDRNRCLFELGRLDELGGGDVGAWAPAELHRAGAEAPARLGAHLERVRRAGDRWSLLRELRRAAAAHRHLRTGVGGQALLDEAAALVASSGSVLMGALIATEQAFTSAASGEAAGARGALTRARAAVASGGDWHGLPPRLAHAEAAVLVVEGRAGEADGAFRRALRGYREGARVWAEASLLVDWGRALHTAGDRRGGSERIEEAVACYRSFGAGEPLTALLDADSRLA